MSQPVNVTSGGGNRGPMMRSRQLSLDSNVRPDEDFFEMIMRCQGSRLEDQRSSLPPTIEEPSPPNVSSNKRSS